MKKKTIQVICRHCALCFVKYGMLLAWIVIFSSVDVSLGANCVCVFCMWNVDTLHSRFVLQNPQPLVSLCFGTRTTFI